MTNQAIVFFPRRPGKATIMANAEQLGLFAVPVHVAGSTDKHGRYRAPHIALRRKRIAQPAQGVLFTAGGDPIPAAHGIKSPKLDRFLAKHGGPARMAATLSDQPPEARAKLIDAMAHLDGLDAKAVMAKLGARVYSPPPGALQSGPKSLQSASKPTESAHAEGDKWVMPLSEAVAEHRELVEALESPGKTDDKVEAAEQGAELSRMEAAQADASINSIPTDSRLIDAGVEGAEPEPVAETPEPEHEGADVSPPPELVEHVTRKGKTIRGIIRRDLTRDQAKVIDEYTFQKDGGWFIRDKYLEASRAVAGDPDHSVEQEVQDAQDKAIAARVAQAAKLREASEKIIGKADEEIHRDRKTNTHRRAGMAANIIQRAERSRAIGVTMGNLADAIESGEAKHLAGVTSRAAVETLESALDRAMYERDRGLSYSEQEKRKGRAPDPEDIKLAALPELRLYGDVARTYANDLRKLKKSRLADILESRVRGSGDFVRLNVDEAREIIRALKDTNGRRDIVDPWHIDNTVSILDRLAKLGITDNLGLRMALAEFAMFRAGARKEDPIKAAERALIGMKIPGYFPTPAGVVDRMVDIAGIQPGMRVLEPSAGKGNIADAVRAAGVAPDVVEPSSTLRSILEAKGYTLAGYDFMDIEAKPVYDAVVMNPPFEHGQDQDHVRRAYDFLKPGGTLVAVMSSGTFFRGDKKAAGFRDWLDEVGGEAEPLPEGTFMESERQTGVSTHMVTIRKPDAAEVDSEAVAATLADDKADLAEALRHAPDSPETRELVEKVHAAAQAGPKEGDTKVEDGVSYVLRDGRWQREQDDDAGAFTPGGIDKTKAMLALHSKIEELGGKAKLAEMFRAANKDHGYLKMQAEEILRKFGETLGLSRDQTLAEFGLKEVTKERSSAPAAKGTDPINQGGDFSDLDPSSPNYRYRDTGYIAGSRKEDAANAIKAAAARGEQNTYTSINWEELEKNPRQAKEVITKSNLFGSVDWEALKANGMQPAAGFLVDRIYAAIAPAPSEDSRQAREDYTLGLESLRARLEKCLTPDDVTRVLNELQEEYDGAVLTEEETARYNELRGASSVFYAKSHALKEDRHQLWLAVMAADEPRRELQRNQDRRIRRGWKPDPELDKQMEAAQPAVDAARAALDAWDADHPEMKEQRRDLGGGWTAYNNDIEYEASKLRDAMQTIVAGAKLRNKLDNPLHRAWHIMGERFVGVLRYRRAKGSDAFAKHVAEAKSGRIADWSWAEKTVTRTPRASQESARFQLKVADTYERVGGRPVKADSTATLKAMFGLRDVQSGNWVLRDVNAAKFHVEQSAGALADLADVLGLPDEFVSLNGRLAMAFGARGKGAVGWADTAPRAHYESVQRVVNLTKNGGGCLGHEWFHGLDNMLREVSGAGESGAHEHVTESPGLLHDADMARAVEGLVTVMTAGEHRKTVGIEYTAKDYRLAQHNLKDPARFNTLATAIAGATDLEAALDVIDKQFGGRADRKAKGLRTQWRTLAAAWFDGKPEGGTAQAQSGKRMSSFAYEAWILDQGKDAGYYSRTHEMAARAFQAWCEDRLAGLGRRNDYLSVYADNKYHYDPIFNIQWRPYPEDEERQRINAAFDNLFEVLRRKREMLKAMMALS